ncbi:hypothetical protein L1049_019486 [Liquidambar formosana]|uniref:Uncharacterized protein n=1 Tax=Liquidambar formosana TaxID=63359 RepID=A0AAP0S884_LIQFO
MDSTVKKTPSYADYIEREVEACFLEPRQGRGREREREKMGDGTWRRFVQEKPDGDERDERLRDRAIGRVKGEEMERVWTVNLEYCSRPSEAIPPNDRLNRRGTTDLCYADLNYRIEYMCTTIQHVLYAFCHKVV